MGKIRKLYFLCILGIAACMLSGCKNRELEDRYFPLAMEVHYQDEVYSVEYALADMKEETGQAKGGSEEQEQKKEDAEQETAKEKTLQKACDQFQSQLDKYMDLGHLKAIILGTNIVEDPVLRKEVLGYFESQAVFSRNTVVFLYNKQENQSLISEISGEIQSIGTYLEDLLKNHPQHTKWESQTLGGLINYWHNGRAKIQIPLLVIKNKKPIISEEYDIVSYEAAD